MLREIVFDTETTGFHYDGGDRLIEIGAVELINHMPTGRVYHQYINPERDVPEDAVKVHGLTTEFLQNYPKLSEIAQDFIDFVGDDGILVAHNATFDINFINYEFKHKGFKTYSWDRVVDTLEIARNKFPGARNNLDALCRRFNIDNSARTKHGALLDAELLAEVYLELLGGAEPSMELSHNIKEKVSGAEVVLERTYRAPRSFVLTDEEENLHQEFLSNKISDALWLK
ncbi:MAG: DNA polymerase III subunit epsilon [Alphaproteobacteria bacterium]|nr:DNA polymerase III subunit epsilon [Alphaproteobacteria bacterium]